MLTEASQRNSFKSLGTFEIDFEVWVSMSLVGESSGPIGDKIQKKIRKEAVLMKISSVKVALLYFFYVVISTSQIVAAEIALSLSSNSHMSLSLFPSL
jgi:hypothetical protein